MGKRERGRQAPTGSLLSREERFVIRQHIRDVKRDLQRASRPEETRRLECQLAGLQREQQTDRASRPRGKKAKP